MNSGPIGGTQPIVGRFGDTGFTIKRNFDTQSIRKRQTWTKPDGLLKRQIDFTLESTLPKMSEKLQPEYEKQFQH